MKMGTPGEDAAVRNAGTAFAVAITAHLLLFAVKLAMGLASHSYAVRADAWSNFASVCTAVIGLTDYRMRSGAGAGRASSEEKKTKRIRHAEYIAAFVLAFLIFEIGFSFFSRSFSRLRHPAAVGRALPTVFVLLLCILFRRAVSAYYIRAGARNGYGLLPEYVKRSKAANLRTLIAAAAVVTDQFLHINTDFVATLILSFALMAAAVRIAAEAIRPAVEEEPDQELIRALRARLREYSIVAGIGSVKTRFFGSGRRMAAIRLKVPKEADLADIAGSIRAIEETVGKEFGVTLVLHADPIESSDREMLRARNALEKDLERRDERLSFDHFHLVRGREFSNLIFDLFVPPEYDEERTKALTDAISEKMRMLDPRYICVISPRKLS